MGASVPSTLRGALEPWCAVGATGALRVEDPPGGAIFIVDGRLSYAECGLVSGVDKLLTASGRVPADVWRAAVAAGRATGRIGDTLISDGHISRHELALSALSALMDAAFFLFDAAVTAQFEPEAVNPLGAFCELEFAAVCAEVDRRRRLLDDVWPDRAIDTAAVVPARRIRGHQVSLTAAQWEIVANADRRRSPADLARLLGRETFVMLLEARRLARSGLIEPGRPGGSAVAESVAAVRARTAAAMVRATDQRTQDQQHRDQRAGDERAGDERAGDERARDERARDEGTQDHRAPGQRAPGQRVADLSSVDSRARDQRAQGQRAADLSAVDPRAREQRVQDQRNREKQNHDPRIRDLRSVDQRPLDRRVPEQRVDAGSAVPARGSAAVPAAAASVTPLTAAGQAQAADEQGRRDQPGPVPLPRRRAGEPQRWPANPADDGRAVEECSESTLVRIHRALRALR